MSDETAPAMDYDSHEQTYEGFINFSKIGTIAVLTIVVCLIMFAFGGTAAASAADGGGCWLCGS